MAILHACSASSHPLTAPKIISQIGKTRLTSIASIGSTTNHKWRITQDLTLCSETSKHHDCLTKESSFSDMKFYVKHTQKLADVRFQLWKIKEDPLEGLDLVDAIQRLGIDYQFQEEIEAVLNKLYIAINNTLILEDQDLYKVSLCFRLLRQQGYYVPADVFDKFKGKDGKFEAKLGQDISGLMSLYEASQLRIEGEDTLEEAENFSSGILNERMTFLDDDEARIVRNTLGHPCQKSLTRFMATNFIGYLNSKNGCENSLLELAKLDFDMVQSIHRRELLQISKWWEDLGLAKELKHARNQPLKWFVWPLATLTDPSLSEERIELTKSVSLIYIIDDIFDVYGTLDELTLFTEAVNRWDFAATEKLPDYMKLCFKALHDITNEIAYKIYKKHGYNPVDSLQNAWATLCNAFLVEAKWFASGQLPKSEEYLRNGIVSSGVHVVLVHIFFLLGDGRTQESANLLNDNPAIISYVATILRLWDDLGSAKDENQDGQDGSYVKCYMEEHQGSTVEIAKQYVTNMISETWKQLNKECLSPNPFSSTFTKASLNLARLVPSMYSYDNNQRLPILEEHIKSILDESVPL